MVIREKGYCTASSDGTSPFYIPNAEHIEKCDVFEGDADACIQAEKDGIELIYGMQNVPDGVYLDNSRNRNIILQELKNFPSYKNVTVKQRI